MYNKKFENDITQLIGEGKSGKVTSIIELTIDKNFIVHARCVVCNTKTAKTKKINVEVNWEFMMNAPNKYKMLKDLAYSEIGEMKKLTMDESRYFWPIREHFIQWLSEFNYRNIYYQFMMGKLD